MTGTEPDRRGTRRGRYAAVIGAIGATAAAALLAVTLTGPAARAQTTATATAAAAAATVTATDTAGVPADWAPVAYERARLAVPASWLVENPGQFWCAPPPDGLIFAGTKPVFPSDSDCRLTTRLAWIVSAGSLPTGISQRKPTAVINGFPVYRRPSAKGTIVYLVPRLDVRIGARGPGAARVLATLHRSPLSVVLRRGPAAAVPAGWTWHKFGGTWFAAPRSWIREREDRWETCGTGEETRTLLLINAVKPPFYLPCPAQIPTAGDAQAQPGLTVVSGKYAARSVGEHYAGCRQRRGVRICLSKATGSGGFPGGVLVFSVTRPRHAAVYFLLGLSGSGTSARAVFDSAGATRR